MDETRPKRFYRVRKVAEIFDVGNSTIYDWVARGIIDPPIKYGPRASGWTAEMVSAAQEKMLRK